MELAAPSSPHDAFNRARAVYTILGDVSSASFSDALNVLEKLNSLKAYLARCLEILRDAAATPETVKQTEDFYAQVCVWQQRVAARTSNPPIAAPTLRASLAVISSPLEALAELARPARTTAPTAPLPTAATSPVSAATAAPVNVELMNTAEDSVHYLDFYCKCDALLCHASSIYRFNRNCVWTREVSSITAAKKAEWNPHKRESWAKLSCARCGILVGGHYPGKRLYKLFYVQMNGKPNLYCRPVSPFTTVVEAAARHAPLDAGCHIPFPRQGTPIKRDLERERVREPGLPEEDKVLDQLAAQLRDATLRDAISLKQQAEIMREQNRTLQDQNRDLAERLDRMTCSVCLDRQIDRVLRPCGHAFCAECVQALCRLRAPCPRCRGQINEVQKLFM